MSLYQIQTIANPQPGTTNTPFPAGPVPAFVPVTTTVVDVDAATILANTNLLFAKLQGIDATVFQINANISAIIAQQRDIDKMIADLDAALLGYAASITSQSKVVSMKAASDIQKNNFGRKMMDPEDKVQLPPKEDQLKQSMIEGLFLKDTIYTSGVLTSFIIDQFRKANDWLVATELYKTIKGWVQKQLDGFYTFLTREITPSTPYTVVTTEAAATLQKIVT
jgi:hypothetical protein